MQFVKRFSFWYGNAKAAASITHGDFWITFTVTNRSSKDLTNGTWTISKEGASRGTVSVSCPAYSTRSQSAFATSDHQIALSYYECDLITFTGTLDGQNRTWNFPTNSMCFGATLTIPEDVPEDDGGLIPAMTSHTTPSGIASADSEYSYWGEGVYAAWHAFDRGANSVYDAWAPEYPEGAWPPYPRSSGWLKYTFVVPVIARSYTITAAGGYHPDMYAGPPSAWTFEGWNGASWVILDTHSGVSGGGGHYSFSNETAYSAYRLNMTATQSNISGLQVGDFQIYPS